MATVPGALSDLRSQIRLQLADATAWPDATLNNYITDAIKYYSTEYPRLWRYETTLTSKVSTYELPGAFGFLRLVSVQLTSNGDSYTLRQVAENGPEWSETARVFAVIGADDQTDTESETASARIVFPFLPTGSEYLTIDYYAAHQAPASDSDPITVPRAHWEALVAFVDFRAHWQLEAAEAAVLDGTSISLSQLGENSRRAWNRYKEIMARLTYVQAGQSTVLTWDNSRIY